MKLLLRVLLLFLLSGAGRGVAGADILDNTDSLSIFKNNTVKQVDNITDDVLLSYVESQYTHGNFSNEVYLSLKDKRGQELKQGIEEVLGINTISLIDELSVSVKNACSEDELDELIQNVIAFDLAKTQPQKFIDGKNFERGIADLIDNGDQAFLNQVANHANVNLSQFTPLKQLQINLPNGGYMIADNVWYKVVLNADGSVKHYEVILNECKLSSSAPWTTRQNELLDVLNSGTNTFTLRSIKFEPDFPKGSIIKIQTVVSTVGNGTVSGGYTVTKVF